MLRVNMRRIAHFSSIQYQFFFTFVTIHNILIASLRIMMVFLLGNIIKLYDNNNGNGNCICIFNDKFNEYKKAAPAAAAAATMVLRRTFAVACKLQGSLLPPLLHLNLNIHVDFF